jgi:hypothetical protein
MHPHTPQGQKHLDDIRRAIRAVVEYKTDEAAAIALGLTVEALLALTGSPYGRAFYHSTYRQGRQLRGDDRRRVCEGLRDMGMTPEEIGRALNVTRSGAVGDMMADEPPPRPVNTQEGPPCRKCRGTEKYIRNNKCAPCERARGKRKTARRREREGRTNAIRLQS